MEDKQLNQINKRYSGWLSTHHVAGWVGLIVLFAAVVGWVYAMQTYEAVDVANLPMHTSTQMADVVLSKTYINSKAGFRLDYPGDWVIDEKTYPGEVCFASPSKAAAVKSLNYEGTCGEIVFGATSYIDTANPESVKQITLGRNLFTFYKGGAAYEDDSYLFVYNKKAYNFETTGGELVEKVLSSFEITK